MVFWCAVSSDQVTFFVPMRAGSCREALMSAWLLRSCPSFVNPVVLFLLAEAGDKWALAGVDLPISATGSGRPT